MEFIKCPDCEQLISEHAKYCPHCGCVFRVCPECGTVSAGKPKFCPGCGFQFEAVEKLAENQPTPRPAPGPAPRPAPKQTDEKGLMFWFALGGKKPPIKVFYSVLGWIELAVFVLAVFGTFATETFVKVFVDSLLYVFLRHGATVLDVIKYLWIAFTALSIIRGLIEAGAQSDAHRFGYFAQVQNLSIPELIDREFKRGFGKDTRSVLVDRWHALSRAIDAIRFKEDAIFENRVQQSGWWMFFLDSVLKISFCVCAIANSNAYMTCIGKFHFLKDWEWTYIIVFIAIGVVYWIFATIVEHYVENYEKKQGVTQADWIRKNLPQHFQAYTQLKDKLFTINASSDNDEKDDY